MSLRLRITIATLLCVLLVSTGLMFASKMISSSWSERFESATQRGNSVLWKKIINSQLDSMESGLSAVTRDRKVRKLIKNGDRDSLIEEAAPSFRRLSASNVLTKEQLIDTNGFVLFSMPNNTSAKSDKILVQRTLDEGRLFKGIERDNGELVVELAFPILQRGKMIGAGLFMRDLQSALNDFKKNNESDVSVVNESGQIEVSTNLELFENLNIKMPALGKTAYLQLSQDEQHYGITITPITNPNGKPLAHLVDIRDHTESIATTNSIITSSYVAIVIILILVAIFFSWYIRRAFIPMEKAIQIMKDISAGDLTMSIHSNSNDEVGRLLQGMESMVTNLREVITSLVSMSQQLKHSSTQLHLQSDKDNEGVKEQLSQTEQVATAMNEMSATVHEVARNAADAADAANNAHKEAAEGQQIVASAMNSIHTLDSGIQNSANAIRKLENETSEIGTVLDVIRGIAEQTNLLALNAAIEAARAGEQGRGFAVVADEVRTLAGRTQQSTQDIQTMIERLQSGAADTVSSMQLSTEQVVVSVEATTKAGNALETITSAVTVINDMNLQIASAAEEQSSVAEEINRNVVNINQVAEQSAEGVGKTAAESDQLNNLTIELGQLVGRFKV